MSLTRNEDAEWELKCDNDACVNKWDVEGKPPIELKMGKLADLHFCNVRCLRAYLKQVYGEEK